MSTFEQDIEIIENTLDLDLTRVNRDYMYGMGMAIVSDHIYEYCFTESENSGQGVISRMIDAIIRFIRGINERVSSLFAKDDHVEIESFLQSETGQIQLAYDVEAINKEVDKQILEGRKMIQAISSVTGISDEKVAGFCDTCGKLVENHGGMIVKMSAIGAVRAFVDHKAFNDLDKKVSDFRGVDTNLEAWKKSYDAINAGTDAKRKKKRAEKEAKRQARMQRQTHSVVNAISGMVNAAGKAKATVSKQIATEYSKVRTKMNRRK